MNYKSPIEIIEDNINVQLDGEILKAVYNVGIKVDRKELIKALAYDREQYIKGFNNGYNKAIMDMKLKAGEQE